MRDFDLSPYARSTVGFDHMFSLLEQAVDASHGYPPYNIERSDETHYRITLAIAGFREKDLVVETRDGVLTVAGKNEEPDKQEYLYRGIAGRQFERRFQLADRVEVRGAKLDNGLLHIDLERVIPEEMKPRRIAINGSDLRSIEGNKAA
jgi:molecular chaperone IbpA